jgi:hypothetical protein
MKRFFISICLFLYSPNLATSDDFCGSYPLVNQGCPSLNPLICNVNCDPYYNGFGDGCYDPAATPTFTLIERIVHNTTKVYSNPTITPGYGKSLNYIESTLCYETTVCKCNPLTSLCTPTGTSNAVFVTHLSMSQFNCPGSPPGE